MSVIQFLLYGDSLEENGSGVPSGVMSATLKYNTLTLTEIKLHSY